MRFYGYVVCVSLVLVVALASEVALAAPEVGNEFSEAPQKFVAVYLTFDDGPEPGTTQVLDSLKKYGVRATFFISSDNLAVSDKVLIKR